MSARARRLLGTVAAIAALLAWWGLAFAEPPPGTDPNSALSGWVRGLHRASSGMLCCALSDCRPTRIRLIPGGVEAWIGREQYGPDAPDAWQPVPDDVIEDTVADGPAPDARGAWVCFYGGEVHCAVFGDGL